MKNRYVSNGIDTLYDQALDYDFSMYDNLPYVRNPDVCNGDSIAMYSGHVIKFYSCSLNEKKKIISNRDDCFTDILKAKEKHISSTDLNEDLSLQQDSDQITQAQIQTLLEDNSENDYAESDDDDTTELNDSSSDLSENDTTESSGSNLDDIEDW